MNAVFRERYAELLVGACLGIAVGARLRVVCEAPHRESAKAIAAAAWKRGAREVRIEYSDPSLFRIGIDNMDEEWLDDVSGFTKMNAQRYVSEGWSYLRLTGEEYPEALEGVDPMRLQRLNKAGSLAGLPFQKAAMSSAIAWCVAPHPTEAWARTVYRLSGKPIPGDPEAALWADLAPVLRLDAKDPAAAWLAHVRTLEKRAIAMNEAAISRLRFRGPGTDLRVGLSPRSRWAGGGGRTQGGAWFTANIPTEEVFTTPDARLTTGRVASTRPVKVLGASIEGAWFVFEGGLVVESGATRNAEVLRSYLDIDPGSRRLGEIALVEEGNPVGNCGLVFGNGLLDENASSHLALGSGYEEAFEGSLGMDEAARLEAGFNDSLVHTDFMIGGPGIEVDLVDVRGRERPLLAGGSFVL
jgi:aminopeptidase